MGYPCMYEKKLLENRPKSEDDFEYILKSIEFDLKDLYSMEIRPQRPLIIHPTRRYPKRRFYAYADFFVRMKHKATNQGRRFWIEIDGGYHKLKDQVSKDEIRQKNIEKYCKGKVFFMRFFNEEVVPTLAFRDLLKEKFDFIKD